MNSQAPSSPHPASPVPGLLDILYLDNHLLVVCKPAGLLAQADATGDPDLLSLGKDYLKAHFHKPGNVYLGLVHRLDRPASGVMVFARTSKAAARLSEQFRARTPEKRYLAMVEGTCTGSGERVDYLAKTDQQVRIVSPSHPQAQRAELAWRGVAARGGRSLVEVELRTGRPHQVRLQLATMGFPIVGDFRYGATRELDGRNLALHCYRLAIDHPTRQERMTWMAPPPASWGDLFRPEIERLLS